MSFEKLLEELDTMAKSLSADEGQDDERIQAAADGDADADGDGENDVTGEHTEPDGDENGGAGDGDGDEQMGKSFAFTLEDGTVIEAQDGTELVKSLMVRVDNTEAVMSKALGQAIDLIGKQGDMLKSLQAEVKRLAGEGRGRKAVVSVAEKAPVGTMAKSEQTGMSGQEFMAKALAAQSAGRLTGLDIARAESALNRGIPVPQDIVARVTQ